MSLLDKLDQFLVWAVTSVMASLFAGIGWLIRRVFTNQQEIEMLKNDLEHRAQQRDEDRERIANIEKGVATIQRVLMEVSNDSR